MSDGKLPTTRWEQNAHRGYADRFRGLIESGADIEGEARLADVLAPRGATVLDAGAGMGRVGAALQRRGHRAVAVEKDPSLVAMSRKYYPELPVINIDILALDAELLTRHEAPTSYDVVVLVGNVIVLAAEDTETRMLRTLGGLLAPQGRILVGFHHENAARQGRPYSWEEFDEHVAGAGLVLQHRFGSYELAPPGGDYAVGVLSLP